MSAAGRRLTIGVTGHRLNQLSPEDLPALTAAIDDILGVCEGSVPGPAGWTLISALAEGTDRIAARAALARGWRLDAPLPFARSRYIEDFETEASRAEFRALCAAAEEVSIAPDPGENGDGYTAAGRSIVARSDALIAVWKGAAPAGPGGTAHVISDMLATGGGVVWINPSERLRLSVLLPLTPGPDGSPRSLLAAALSAAFMAAPHPATLP